MDIRQLQFLAALAREKHFTRAAAACNISQPTLSGRIRFLEQELGVPIVSRGQRYHGLTPEGERVLKWAHVILDNWQAMQQELAQISGRKQALLGRLAIGVVPSALPMVALLTKQMQAGHPGVDFTILSHSTAEILRGLNDFSLDAGIFYNIKNRWVYFFISSFEHTIYGCVKCMTNFMTNKKVVSVGIDVII
jgi:DNA-binding transcriptional LysR family regulator